MELANQHQEQERQLNKNRSKKDLKNKFKSSSAIYNNGIKTGEPEDEDDMIAKLDTSDTKHISDIIQRHIQKEEEDLKDKSGGSKSQCYPMPPDLDNMKQIDDNEIDEIIKQHLIEEEQTSSKKKKGKKGKAKKKQPVKKDSILPKDMEEPEDETDEKKEKEEAGEGEDGDDDDDEDDEDEDDIDDETVGKKGAGEQDDPYDYLEDSLSINMKSPKQTLVEHLRLLADIFNSSLDEASEYYDQIFDERAQFMLDFENILKIMTFDETVEYVLPCMQIYSSEQDYLKLKLFQNLEKLFKKLFKAEVFIPKTEIIDIITINIFPLASRMLMLSEEPVQIEGVEALLNLSKQYIPKQQS